LKSSYFGKLSGYREDHVKRLIMKLLVGKVLRESFSTFQIEQTILVYLKIGRQYENFKKGLIRVRLTDCTEKECEEIKRKEKIKEERDKARLRRKQEKLE
jgi:hypothetical protein